MQDRQSFSAILEKFTPDLQDDVQTVVEAVAVSAALLKAYEDHMTRIMQLVKSIELAIRDAGYRILVSQDKGICTLCNKIVHNASRGKKRLRHVLISLDLNCNLESESQLYLLCKQCFTKHCIATMLPPSHPRYKKHHYTWAIVKIFDTGLHYRSTNGEFVPLPENTKIRTVSGRACRKVMPELQTPIISVAANRNLEPPLVEFAFD